jgi:pre-mRNA-splicing factor ISY1
MDGTNDGTTSDSLPSSKRLHVSDQTNGNGTTPATTASAEATALLHARTTAAYIPFLSAEDLVPPKMPSQKEMEAFLLGLRKKALMEEYFGEQQAS